MCVGQKKTCGRCYQIARVCPGNGLAKMCQENKGERVRLIDHMKEHWATVGFAIQNFKLDSVEESERPITEDVPIKDGNHFSPQAKGPKVQGNYIG